jgi:hypothetical protein
VKHRADSGAIIFTICGILSAFLPVRNPPNWKNVMAFRPADFLPAIIAAKDAGLTIGAIQKTLIGESRAKDRKAEVEEKLVSLVREGTIWGPLTYKRTKYYFAAGQGPSIETASRAVADLVLRSSAKLLSKSDLKKKITGMNGRFFDDGIKHAVASRTIVALACGKAKYYLHRDVAADYFDFEVPTTTLPHEVPPTHHKPTLAFEDMLPVYRRLKAEQGGFSAVKIFDLMKALNKPKDVLHHLLVEEARAGRVTIHPTTSVELSAEVLAASIRLTGFPEPFVSVVVKNES